MVLDEVFRFDIRFDECRTVVDNGEVLLVSDLGLCQDDGGFREDFGEGIEAELRSWFELNSRRVLDDDDVSWVRLGDNGRARRGFSLVRVNVERRSWLLLRKKLGGERDFVVGDDLVGVGELLVIVETFWHEFACVRRGEILRTFGEFERDVGESLRELRLRILVLLLFVGSRRLVTVDVELDFVLITVAAVVVTVDDEDISSGSIDVGIDGDKGEFVRDFDVSSDSFSVEIRRDTAHRCIRWFNLVLDTGLLLFVDGSRKLSTEGVRLANLWFGFICWSIDVNDG